MAPLSTEEDSEGRSTYKRVDSLPGNIKELFHYEHIQPAMTSLIIEIKFFLIDVKVSLF